jgi:hypothetical protein
LSAPPGGAWCSRSPAVPIAVAANVARIFGTGLCVQYWDPDKAMGFFHEFQGWLMFLVSLSCLYLVHRRHAPGRRGRGGIGMRSPKLWLVVLLMSFTAWCCMCAGTSTASRPAAAE